MPKIIRKAYGLKPGSFVTLVDKISVIVIKPKKRLLVNQTKTACFTMKAVGIVK